MTPQLTRRFNLAGYSIEIRPMEESDEEGVAQFALALPQHDLLFLQRDIRNPKVLAAWFGQIRSGQIPSLVAASDRSILATTALVRDALGWSAHVAEARVLVGPGSRGTGLGRLLAEACVDQAIALGLEKLIVRMTPDQINARKVFEELGFKSEALLRRQVLDAEGAAHDIVIHGLDLLRPRIGVES